jgi:hypothetical protein
MDNNGFVVQQEDAGRPACQRLRCPQWQSAFTGQEQAGMSTPMREMWRSCEDVAASLTIPEPWDFGTFVKILGDERGRRIELIPVVAEPGQPCGLLVSTDQADYIFYAANTTQLHQLHIGCHEVAHLLRGHGGTTALDVDVSRLLMPSLPASVIERVLGRTVYSAAEEHDAELLASLIMRRIGRTQQPRREVRPEVAETLTRMAGVFDSQPRLRHG